MCGFLTLIDLSRKTPLKKILSTLNLLIHRGPDSGSYITLNFDQHSDESYENPLIFMGHKPLYFSHNNDKFAFCSEINPIRQLLNSGQSPNRTAIFDFLLLGLTDTGESTLFDGIYQIGIDQECKPGRNTGVPSN